MPTNQQRREAERRRLQRQLEERRAREAARRRFRLIASIASTLVLLAAIVVIVIVATSGSDSKKKKDVNAGGNAGKPSSSTSASASASPTTSAPAAALPSAPCSAPPKGATVTFKGVTVGEATNLKHAPKVSSKGGATPKSLLCEDLVVGKGKAATPSSTVTVQYTGVLYKDGKQFDSSWSRGQPAQFPLTGVVQGFTQGIAGAGKVAPMKVGGRRVMILPASLGYGSQGTGGIPPNSVLVFVVDLKSIDR